MKAERWFLLDKLGAVGAFLAAAATPCCFPALATVGAAFGLSALSLMRGYMAYVIQVMVVLALLGDMLAYRRHHRRGPLAVGIIATLVVLFAYYAYYEVTLVFAGLAGLAVAAVWNVIARRRCPACANTTTA